MTIDFFLKNYNLSDLDIKKIFVKENKLYIKADYNVYLELIANGYRPEMNLDMEKTFVFGCEYKDHHFKSTDLSIISFDNNILKVKIGNEELELYGDINII